MSYGGYSSSPRILHERGAEQRDTPQRMYRALTRHQPG